MRFPATLAIHELDNLSQVGDTFTRGGVEMVFVNGTLSIKIDGAVPKELYDYLKGLPRVRAVREVNNVFGERRTVEETIDHRCGLYVKTEREREWERESRAEWATPATREATREKRKRRKAEKQPACDAAVGVPRARTRRQLPLTQPPRKIRL